MHNIHAIHVSINKWNIYITPEVPSFSFPVKHPFPMPNQSLLIFNHKLLLPLLGFHRNVIIQ